MVVMVAILIPPWVVVRLVVAATTRCTCMVGVVDVVGEVVVPVAEVGVCMVVVVVAEVVEEM